jgi:NAD-dependent deacetylase
MLPLDQLEILDRELGKGFDVYFSVGTTSVFPYIQQPIVDARFSGKPTIEINPADTEISAIVDIRLRMRAAEALDAIWNDYLTGGEQ